MHACMHNQFSQMGPYVYLIIYYAHAKVHTYRKHFWNCHKDTREKCLVHAKNEQGKLPVLRLHLPPALHLYRAHDVHRMHLVPLTRCCLGARSQHSHEPRARRCVRYASVCTCTIVCMYVWMYVHFCIHVYMKIPKWVYPIHTKNVCPGSMVSTHLHLSTLVWLSVCIDVCICAQKCCMYVYVYIRNVNAWKCICIDICVPIYLCMYVYICKYVYSVISIYVCKWYVTAVPVASGLRVYTCFYLSYIHLYVWYNTYV